MRHPWLYLEAPINAGSRWLEPDRSHYLTRVLRLPAGATVEVFDGLGSHAEGHLSQLERRRTELTLGTPVTDRHGESPLDLTLAVVLPKGARMDQILQKSTELGVTRVQLLTSERCEVRLDARRLDNRLGHWREIMISACEQCHRTCVPELLAPVALGQWLAGGPSGWILDPRAPATRSIAGPAPSAMAIVSGPEGGFSDAEGAAAVAAGLTPISLGPRILRAETAPLVAISRAQTLFGDLDHPGQ